MNLILTKYERNNRTIKETFLINIIESVVKENLPTTSSNYKDLIYSIEFKDNSLILKSYVLGGSVKLDPSQLWNEGKMVIARCLPKFTKSNSSQYKNILDIITTNSHSMIWLCDDMVDDQIKHEIFIESEKPLFTMCYDNIEEKVIVANFVSEQNHLLVPSSNNISSQESLRLTNEKALEIMRITNERVGEIMQYEGCYSIR